jgi:hypothetical protein
VASHTTVIEEIRKEINAALHLLSQSLGIRSLPRSSSSSISASSSFSSPMGPSAASTTATTMTPTVTPTVTNTPGSTTQLDGHHVSAILQTVIGKKLLIRALHYLSPSHRWALIPVILARILLSLNSSTSNTSSGGGGANTFISPVKTSTGIGSAPATSASATSGSGNPGGDTLTTYQQETLEIERKLLRSISEYLKKCYQQHRENQQAILNSTSGSGVVSGGLGQAPIITTATEFTHELLSNLRQCLKNIMITQMNKKSQLKESLLADRTRAEVLYLVVQLGDQLVSESAETLESQITIEWIQTKEAFMSLLDG